MALTKILNDENKTFRPVLTDKLVLDTKPTVGSYNAVTSDGVARAVAGASGEVPAVEEGDNGKVLTAICDEGGAAVEWTSPAVELPAYTADDVGKVLQVQEDGTLAWVLPDQPSDPDDPPADDPPSNDDEPPAENPPAEEP